ncbi:adenine deaminase [Methanosalsum natronophilum]|nr:adenine deaminase [Methanosalsum natronophilum]
MTMSFMPLLVILKLKVTDKALFNPDEFQFIDLELAISIECLRSSLF